MPAVEEALPGRVAMLQKRVEAIYRTSHGAVALVDSQPVRVGDVLDGLFRITAIRLDGLMLEPVVPASPPAPKPIPPHGRWLPLASRKP